MTNLRSRPGPRTRTRRWRFAAGDVRVGPDTLATEEPLEIRVLAGGRVQSSVVTMRTPGDDFDLAVGFLFAEGIVEDDEDVLAMSYCTDPGVEQRFNIVNVEVSRMRRDLERTTSVTSACGVCGKTSLEAVEARGLSVTAATQRIDAATITHLPGRLRAAQSVFERTGGLHAAGLFTFDGDLVAVREDVGRHNALDKLVGHGCLERSLPWRDHVVLLSGRASFELVHKAVAAGVSVLCAVSAPSSLAVDLARRFDLTLVGFLRDDRFNVYTGPERIASLREEDTYDT